MTSWDELQNELREEVSRRSAAKVAEALPAGKRSVYRMISDKTPPNYRPSLAMRACVERYLERSRRAEMERRAFRRQVEHAQEGCATCHID